MSDGTHVQATLLFDDKDPNTAAIRIMIWPLPNDEALHMALSTAVRDAVNAVMTNAGISSGNITDLATAKGRLQ